MRGFLQRDAKGNKCYPGGGSMPARTAFCDRSTPSYIFLSVKLEYLKFNPESSCFAMVNLAL